MHQTTNDFWYQHIYFVLLEDKLFTRNLAFKLLNFSIAAFSRKSKCYLQFLTNCCYHKIVKFEQNRKIQITQNWDLVDEKVFTMLTISEMLQAHIKQLMMLDYSLKGSIFQYFKIYCSMILKTQFKNELNMGDLQCLFRDGS